MTKILSKSKRNSNHLSNSNKRIEEHGSALFKVRQQQSNSNSSATSSGQDQRNKKRLQSHQNSNSTSNHTNHNPNYHHNHLHHNKNRNLQQQKILQLCDLPTEILEMIICNINIWHRNRIRATCTRLRNCCDSRMLHDFKSSLRKFGKINRTGYEFSALRVIHQATWAYIKAGYCPLFLGAMLPLMRNTYKNPFCPSVGKIKTFLMKFYTLIEESLGNPFSQTSRLLYVITLLGFLNKCNNSLLLSSIDIQPEYWRIVYQLRGSWFGMLWSSTSPQCFNYSSDKNELLILLAEIMIAVHSTTAFKKVWECENKIFVFGHDLSERCRMPKVTFAFDIHGSVEILQLLKSSPVHEDWVRLPPDEFNVSLVIHCQEAIKWGCYPSYRLEIGPYYEYDAAATTGESSSDSSTSSIPKAIENK